MLGEKIKSEFVSKKELLKVLNEEIYKPESHRGMVGWTIPSFHEFIEYGLQVDVAFYHDRIIERLHLE